jgi:hypothetical protein
VEHPGGGHRRRPGERPAERRPGGRPHRDGGRTFPRGALALQFDPGGPVTFRRVDYRETPTPPPAPAADPRARWVHAAVVGNEFNERWGVFQDTGGGAWVESGTDHPKFFRHHYTETARTPEYVELERPDGDRTVVVRLYGRHAEWGPSRSALRREREGGWQK